MAPKEKEIRMKCKFGSNCKESCGHKDEHLKNTGCLNACVCVPNELACKPVIGRIFSGGGKS